MIYIVFHRFLVIKKIILSTYSINIDLIRKHLIQRWLKDIPKSPCSIENFRKFL